MGRSSSPSRSRTRLFDNNDGLPALEVLVDYITQAADPSAPDHGSLLKPGAPTKITEAVFAAAMEGAADLTQKNFSVSACCVAVHELCALVQPPLIAKNHVSEIKKQARLVQKEKRTTAVATMLTPVMRGFSPAAQQRSARAAALVSRLLALLAAVGRSARHLPSSPLAIAKTWAPALGLDATTLQLLLIHRYSAAARTRCARASTAHRARTRVQLALFQRAQCTLR
jgi:hypothetical protein